MVRPPVDSTVRGWVLYDADCGICTKLATACRASLKGRGFEIEPLQSEWVAPELQLSQAAVEQEFRVLTVKGKQYSGADAYRFLLRQYPLGMPLYVLSKIPPFCWTFDRAYKLIASQRHLVSKSCGLR